MCFFGYLENWQKKSTLTIFLKTSEMVDNNVRNHSWRFQVQEKSETILTNFLGAVFGTLEFFKIFFWNHIFLKPSEMVDHNARINPWQFQVQKMSRGHVHIEVVIFFIFYLPSKICLYGGLFLCMFEKNGSHKTRINNKSETKG